MKRRVTTCGLVILAGLHGAGTPAAPPGQEDCFVGADNRLAPYHVFQTARAPDSTRVGGRETDSSAYYPGTDFVTTTALPDQDARYKTYFFTWINRCLPIKGQTAGDAECRVKRRLNGDAVTTTKGNSYLGGSKERLLSDQVRAAFTSYRAADSCSIAQEMQALAMPDAAVEARAAAGHVRLYRAQDRATATMQRLTQAVELADGTRWSYLVNMCVLPEKGAALNFAGFGLDYEVNDNRTPAEASLFLGEYARIAHAAGKSVFLVTDPLPRPTSGIDGSNVMTLLSELDYLSLGLTNGATPGNAAVGNHQRNAAGTLMESYARQLAVLTDGGRRPLSAAMKKHIIWQVPLYQVDLPDAAALQAVVRREGYGGISIARNYVKQGGSCARLPNQITACIALGQCGGNFGAGTRPGA